MTESTVASDREITADSFAAFWANPDPSLLDDVLTDDVVGYWPEELEPTRGKDAYRERIAAVLEMVPDLRLEVVDHAENGPALFIHWIARGTGASGPFEVRGIDRILREDGRVKENVVRYDSTTLLRLLG